MSKTISESCGRTTPGYDACTRGKGHSGPCAHAWLGEKVSPAETPLNCGDYLVEQCQNISPMTGFGRCGLSKGHSSPCEFVSHDHMRNYNIGDMGAAHLVSGPEIRHPQDRSGQLDGTIKDPYHRHEGKYPQVTAAELFPGEIEKSPTLIGTITQPSSYPTSWICSRCNLSNNPRNASCVSDTCTRFSFGKQYYVSV